MNLIKPQKTYFSEKSVILVNTNSFIKDIFIKIYYSELIFIHIFYILYFPLKLF